MCRWDSFRAVQFNGKNHSEMPYAPEGGWVARHCISGALTYYDGELVHEVWPGDYVFADYAHDAGWVFRAVMSGKLFEYIFEEV